jgi:two-component system, NtrC family, response regulator AtoC
MQKKTKILIVDDEPIMRDSLHDWLTDAGHAVLTAGNSEEALKIIEKEKPGVAVIDMVLPETDGLVLLEKAKKINPDLQIVMITAYGSVSTAIKAIKQGAYDYIEKPFPPEKVELLINKLIEQQRLREENLSLRQKLENKYIFEDIISKSARVQKIKEMIKVVAKTNAPVLITGESGTGKEVIARAIHNQSFRVNKPFIIVPCAAIPESMMESELFGQEKNTVKGTPAIKKGKFEQANHGTLYLDEVGDIGLNTQIQLLRVLEDKSFTRIGGTNSTVTDVRLISASSRNILKMIDDAKFSKELYYRLGVVNIELPSLRERREDIPMMAEFFLKKYREENKKDIAEFSNEAVQYMLKYEWPGNIRELDNAIERAVILCQGDRITVNDLSLHNIYAPQKPVTTRTLQEVEKNHIISVLIQVSGNCSEAARILGISRMTLYNKIKAYGLNYGRMGKEQNQG